MKRTWIVFSLGLILSLTVSAQSVSKFIVFGDSLSDTGNSYEYSHHTKPPAALYYQGRYSNGPIWIDYVLKTLFPNKTHHRLFNYAFGGSGVLQSQPNAFTLSQEVDSYLLTHQAKVKSDSWFVIWIGANDYLLSPNSTQKTVNKVIAEMERNIVRLREHGARHLVILGLPDLGLSPFAQDLDLEIQLSGVVQIHNHRLKERIAKLQVRFPETDWHYMDVNQTFSDLIAHPKQFGFVHTTERCLETEVKNNSVRSADKGPSAWLRIALGKHARNAQEKCRDYVFLDQVHPTTYVHQMLAQQFVKIVE